ARGGSVGRRAPSWRTSTRRRNLSPPSRGQRDSARRPPVRLALGTAAAPRLARLVDLAATPPSAGHRVLAGARARARPARRPRDHLHALSAAKFVARRS